MYRKQILFILSIPILIFITSFYVMDPQIGDTIDSHEGIPVYYNGSSISNVGGRHLAYDGYNYGLKWQCVEFTKRFYHQRFGHKMPNSYGHAKDFFDKSLGDVAYNEARGLMQYKNVRYEKPEVNDIIVYDAYKSNPFGHIGIVAEVGHDYIVLVQQNVGKKTRQRLKLVEYNGIYTVADFDVLGWLRF